jgi:hypothetical protein
MTSLGGGGGVWPFSPTPDWVMHMRTLFAYVGLCEESMDSKYVRGQWSIVVLRLHMVGGGSWSLPCPSTGSCTHVTIYPNVSVYWTI